jgi:hypothetical protein
VTPITKLPIPISSVLASIYYPGDGIVAKNNYQTSSGERYDQNAAKCAALQWPLGTMVHLCTAETTSTCQSTITGLTVEAGYWIARQR